VKRIVGTTVIPDRSPHPWGGVCREAAGSLSDLAVTGRLEPPIGTPSTNSHSISSDEARYVMISQRLSNVVLMCGLAAAIGATSGASVDTRPLNWGEGANWRQHLPRTEDLAKSAIRRHAAFQTAERNRQLRNLHLAEDEVIYLRPIDAVADEDMPPAPRESHSGQMPQRASSLEVVLEVKPQQPQVVPHVDEMDQDRHRFADAGPKIVEFPNSSQDGG
jgi:hypothetical protein